MNTLRTTVYFIIRHNIQITSTAVLDTKGNCTIRRICGSIGGLPPKVFGATWVRIAGGNDVSFSRLLEPGGKKVEKHPLFDIRRYWKF
jgi:hypothetical protein